MPSQSVGSTSIIVDDEPVWPEESTTTAVSVRCEQVTSHGIVYVALYGFLLTWPTCQGPS